MSLRSLCTLGGTALLVVFASHLRGADGGFDFETLRARAKALAARPYVARPTVIPEVLSKLTYDEYRLITFNPDRTWWLQEKLPFRLQFYHPGFVHRQPVMISELDGGTVKPIPFSRAFFDYRRHPIAGNIPDNVGFAGFRVLGQLRFSADELVSFLGASYFRALCLNAVYGLSSRGLAINTAEPLPEEFPAFEEFWIQRPEPNAKAFTIFALLNGPSVAGAYRFTVTPGVDTLVQVKAAVYCRQNPKTLGLAPLTSMYWHGENSDDHQNDIRPEVHDSDGLMLRTGNDEWIWRPLVNRRAVSTAAFADENPRGFGLVQRDRKFESYEDLEGKYHLRPSAWIEPMGNWGAGAVRLVELPTGTETDDNIVAFWVPAKLPPPGEPIEFEYRMHWFLDQIKPPAGFVVATRTGYSRTHEPDLRRFVVDFDGEFLRKHPPDPAPEIIVTVGDGAKLTNATLIKNPFNDTWRAAFAIKPDGSGRPVELRCYLKENRDVLTETWSYLWNP